MTDDQAIDRAVKKTGHARFRDLLDPTHADYNPSYWPLVRLLAGDVASFPPLTEQIANAARAAARVAKAIVKRETVIVSQEEQERRLAICETCDHFSESRCTLCGCCANLKTRIATEHCPDNPPRW